MTMSDPVASNNTQSFNGSALNVLFLQSTPAGLDKDENKGADGKAIGGYDCVGNGILARGTNFSYNRRFSHSETEELNTTFTKETNYGKEMVGSGRIQTIFTLKNNDALPSADSLRKASELTILEITGDDHSLNNASLDNPFVVLNAFIGCRIVGESSATQVSQTKMQDVEIIFRRKLSGAEWKAIIASANYPQPA